MGCRFAGRFVHAAGDHADAGEQDPRADAGAAEGFAPARAGVAFSPTHTRKGNRLYRYYHSEGVLIGASEIIPIAR